MRPRSAAAIALCLVPLALLGCKAAPRTLAQTRQQEVRASEHWSKRGGASLASSGRRLVLAEASVEFVTSKFETGDTRQAAFIPPHPVFLAANAAGVGRRDVEFDGAAFEHIAGRIGGALERDLLSRGWRLVPNARVEIAESRARFKTLAPGEAREVKELNFAAADTGRVRTMRVLPASADARVITGPSGARETRARRAMLEELGADALVRVIIRVGVYQGHASFEEGSRILLTTAAGEAELSARRSLLSDRDVLTDKATNGRYTVSESAYLDAVEATAPIFIGMALDALE